MTDALKIIFQHPLETIGIILAIGISLKWIIGAILSPFDKHGGEKAKAQAEVDKKFWSI